MTTWNEIAGDHHTALSWSGGLNRDEDGYPLSPPCSDPSMSGGLDAWFAQAAQRRARQYRCKFCSSMIGFQNRKPLNLLDGSPHRCLADAAEARRNAGPVA
jgi:hypothetical protein